MTQPKLGKPAPNMNVMKKLDSCTRYFSHSCFCNIHRTFVFLKFQLVTVVLSRLEASIKLKQLETGLMLKVFHSQLIL